MARLELELSERELSPLAEILARQFVQRWDMYPRQYDNDRPYFTVNEPLNVEILMGHLRGRVTLGTYLLNPESQGRFIVLDADTRDQWQQLIQAANELVDEGVPGYLERSRQGGHLWLFFDRWLPGRQLREFGRGVMQTHGLEALELYPKQDQLQEGPGSLIRMPFGIHQVTGRRYGFYTPAGKKLAPTLREQLRVLGDAQPVSTAVIDAYRISKPIVPQSADFVPVQAPGEQVSDRIKAAISVEDFVSRYVALTPSGRGYCPFHDDRHKSFGVNRENNYWSCYAGCGGGSIIDFWMLYADCDFKTAVTQLAKMLLE